MIGFLAQFRTEDKLVSAIPRYCRINCIEFKFGVKLFVANHCEFINWLIENWGDIYDLLILLFS